MTTTTTATTPAGAVAPSAAEDGGAVFAAWFGFLFGTGISVGGNVLATWLPKLTGRVSDPAWTPGVWPQVGAAVWPLALLLSVEVLTRTNWRAGLLWTIARLVSVFTVALGGAVISYGHLHEVLTAWRYPAAAAFVGPLVIDGLMLISGFALLSISKNRKDPVPAPAATATATPPVPAQPAATSTPAANAEATAARPARRPATPAKAARNRTSTAVTGRGSDKREKAWAHWQAERAAGRIPKGVDLARVSGADDSLGRRWRREWETAEAAEGTNTNDTSNTTTEASSETSTGEERAA